MNWLKKLLKKQEPMTTDLKSVEQHKVNPIVGEYQGAHTERVISTVNVRTLAGKENETMDDKHLLEEGYVKISSVVNNGIRKNTYRKDKS